MSQLHISRTSNTRFAQEEFTRILARVDLSDLAGTRIFMTGATGFFGYWLLTALEHLNARGHLIKVVALSRRPDDFLRRHPRFAATDWLQLVRGDVRDYDTRLGAFDLMIHGAADTSFDAANQPFTLMETTLSGSLRVAEHARLAGAGRMLFISSGASYGRSHQRYKPFSEADDCSVNPSDTAEVYAMSKLGVEAIAAALAAQSSIKTIIARPFAFIGAGLPPHLVISQLLDMARNADRIVLQSDGSSTRSFLYAADLALWLLVLLARGKSGETYNVGSDEAMRLIDVARVVKDVVASEKPIEILGLPNRNPRQYYVPDIGKVRTELGLDVWTRFEESVRYTAAALDQQSRVS